MKKFLLSILCLFSVVAMQAQTYQKVTSAPDDWSGDYLIVYEDGNIAFNGGLEKLDAVSNTIEVSINGNYIVATDAANAAKFTIEQTDGGYLIKSASGYYIGQTSDANGLKSSQTTTYSNALSLNDDGTVNIVSGGAYLRYNFASDQLRFRYYKSATYTKQKAIALYKLVDGEGGGTVEPEQPEEPEEPEQPEQPDVEDMQTIAEVLAAGVGDAYTQGTVVATYAQGFLISDETGSILVYLGKNYDKSHAAGDVVTVQGATSMYGGMLQFGNTSVVTKTGTATVSHPAATVMDGAAMDAYLGAPVVKYVEYTGTLTISGSYYNVAIEGAATAIGSIQYPIEGMVTAASGNTVKVTGYTIGVSSNKYVNTMAVKVDVVGATEPEQPDVEDMQTIAEVLAAGAGDAYTKGTVVATYARGFLLGDETGTILVYLGSDKGYVAGDVVTISGATSMYGGMLQFGNTSVVTKTGTATVSHPAATVMDGAAMDAYLGAPVVKYVEYTGTLTISGSYYNVAIEGAATAIGSIQYPIEGMVTASSGDVIKVTGYTIGVSSNKYVNTMAVKVEVVESAEPEEPEEPAETKEYTVAEALAAYVDGEKTPAIVKGYIVGAVNSNNNNTPEFGETIVASNIMLSDNADETDLANCIIVQLSSGTDVRKALNLVDNPDNYKKQVKVTGSLEKYFSRAGLKSTSAYEFIDTTGIGNVESEAASYVVYSITGAKVMETTNAGDLEKLTKGIYIVNGKKKFVK